MVSDFVYCTPTYVDFGRNKTDDVADLLKKFGAHKVLIHYGSHHAVKSGLIARVEGKLKEAGIPFVELGGVVPNPRLSLVRKGVEIVKKEGIDFLLAVGGGSVIDSCKAIGYGIANNCDPWDIYSGKRKPESCMPVGVILTIAAAGSEMSNSSVITNEELGLKIGANYECCRCRFAIEDPLLTMTLPAYQTSCGVTDIMMHTQERYFTHGESNPFTDEMAEALLRSVKDAGLTLVKDPQNYEARAIVEFASSLSHNGLTAAGNPSAGDWGCHQLEHALGAIYDCAHGAGLAAVFPSWARYVSHVDPARFVRLGKKVFGIDAKSPEDTVKAFERFYKQIGMPVNIKELLGKEITDDEIDTLADKVTMGDTVTKGDFYKLHKKDCIAIYKMARG